MSLVHSDGVHKAAFRCLKCGHLVPAQHAGEMEYPRQCPVCKSGSVFAHSVEKAVATRPDVLDGLTPEQLSARTTSIPLAPGVALVCVHIPEDWEVLVDADDGHLEELGLSRDDVERHEPFKEPVQASHPPTHHEREATDGVRSDDRVE